MTFPRSERVVFEHNPLGEVICQLKFPTVLEISAEIPARFQNKIRDAYPLYEVERGALPKELAEIANRIPVIANQPADINYKFIAADGSSTISLGPEFIAYTDSKYVRWERFRKEIKRAQEALEEIYHPNFYTRIGLRYSNVIDREKLGIVNQPWNELLLPSLIGLLGAKDNVGAHVENIFTQATLHLDELEDGLATIRHGLGRDTSDKNRVVYIVDVDFYTTERRFSKDVPEILDKFNRLSGDFFRWAISDKLRGILGPRELEPED